MNWADVMRENADAASRNGTSTDANHTHLTTTNSWEPHEVWLTRVKLPRDLAIGRRTARTASRTPGLPA